MVKRCRACLVEKSLDEFYQHPAMADGRLNRCKDCVRNRVTNHRNQNLERVRAYDRERYSTPEGIARLSRQSRIHRALNPERYKARTAVNNAVRDGRLIKPTKCEIDGCEKTRVEAHHEDYSKPLSVRWLCKGHHAEADRACQRSGVAEAEGLYRKRYRDPCECE